jgi:uncharacterized Rossmann fold enzyme
MTTSTGDNHAPYTVAIVAMGPSREDYMRECVAKSSRFQVADETWAINAMAGVIAHDRAIIMDDLPYFAKAAREENPALVGYGDWLHRHPGPIYTQRHYPEYPGSVEYPLEDVLNSVGYAYSNTTVSYAICLAIHMQVKHLKLYGMDFSNRDGKFVEAGRACVEFWLRDCNWRGIKTTIAGSSTLMDQNVNRRLYGYSIPPEISHDGKKFIVKKPV